MHTLADVSSMCESLKSEASSFLVLFMVVSSIKSAFLVASIIDIMHL